MKKYFKLIIVFIFAIILIIYFVDKNESNSVNTTIEDSIIYAVSDIPDDLENITNLSTSDLDIICATSKGLVTKNSNNEIIPCLASEFEVSDDKIEYKFKIRDDIYWSDGSKITCDNIVEFFRQLIKEGDSQEIKALLNVYGAMGYKEGKGMFFNNVAITSKDNYINIRLNSKDDDFLSELTKPQYRIRCPLILWKEIKHNYENINYSGEYKIEEINLNNIILKANDNSKCKMKVINITKDDSSEESMASYEINQRDIVLDPPTTQLNNLKDKGNLISIAQNKGNYLVINNNKGDIPLQGRREIYNNVYKAIEEYHSKNEKDFELAEGCYFRENKNNLILIQERKVNSNRTGEWNKPEVLTIIGKDNKQNRTLCRSIQDWFLNNTDITVKYRLVNEEEFSDKELKSKYDMILVDNIAMVSEKGKFYSNFTEYLSQTDKSLLDKNKSNDYYGEYMDLEQSIFNNYLILPICFDNENIAISSKISNLKLDGNGNLDFETLE